MGAHKKSGTKDLEGVVPLRDVYEFNPTTLMWWHRADIPVPVMAGTGGAVGQSHLFILSGDDGELLAQANELKDDHPGFCRRAWAYHTITDTWTDAGETPLNSVTTHAAAWKNDLLLVSGEIRPRVRTNQVWKISPNSQNLRQLSGV